MLNQIRPAAVEHPETQVLLELGLGGNCIQLPRGTETVVDPAGGETNSLKGQAEDRPPEENNTVPWFEGFRSCMHPFSFDLHVQEIAEWEMIMQANGRLPLVFHGRSYKFQ